MRSGVKLVRCEFGDGTLQDYLPWMLDAVECSGHRLGPPQATPHALEQLRRLLDFSGKLNGTQSQRIEADNEERSQESGRTDAITDADVDPSRPGEASFARPSRDGAREEASGGIGETSSFSGLVRKA